MLRFIADASISGLAAPFSPPARLMEFLRSPAARRDITLFYWIFSLILLPDSCHYTFRYCSLPAIAFAISYAAAIDDMIYYYILFIIDITAITHAIIAIADMLFII